MLGAYYPGQVYPGESGFPASGTLVIQDATISVSTDSVALVQHFTLAINDSLISVTTDNLAIGVNLIISDALISLSSDPLTLIQDFILAINDSTISTTTDGIVLIQQHTLAINDSTISLTTDNLALNILLDIQNALISLSADSFALSQNNILVIADSNISLVADSIVILVFHPPIDNFAGLQDVIPDVPIIDKPIMLVGIHANNDQIGMKTEADRIDMSSLVQQAQNGEIVGVTIFGSNTRNKPSGYTPSSTSTAVSHAATTALMEDAVVLMEDPNTLMGGQFLRGERPGGAVVTVDSISSSIDNGSNSEGVANVSREHPLILNPRP